MKVPLLISSLNFIVFQLLAQFSGSLSGYVYDINTIQPIENTEVIFAGLNHGTITNQKGFFRFNDLEPAKYEIMFKHVGYETLTKKINLTSNSIKEIKVYLDIKPQDLSEYVVESSGDVNKVISKLPYIETVMIKNQIEENAVRDVGDFLRSANNVGGIRKGGTGIDPVVRGLKFSQLNVQVNNGLKIEGGCPNRMDPATAHIEAEDIDYIEILKGPYALKYGPVFGGVINMVTKEPERKDSSYIELRASSGFESNWNGNKELIGLQGAHKFINFNISGGRKAYGNYEDGNGNEIKSGFNKYNYRAQIGIKPNEFHNISLSFDQSIGYDIYFPSLAMDERSDNTKLMSADYTGNFKYKSLRLIKFKIYNSDVHHEMDNKERPISDTVVAISKIHANVWGGRTEAQFLVWKGTLSSGIDYENSYKNGERNKYMILQPGMPIKNEQLWNGASITNTGLFSEYIKPIRSWITTASVRLDINNATSDSISIFHPTQGEIYHYGNDSIQSDYINLSVSLGVTKKINDKFSISVTGGRGGRSPDLTERFIILLPVGYDNYDYLGNPQLEPEYINQTDLTLRYDSYNFGLFQINGFYALINNYITGKLIPPSEQKPLTAGVEGVKQFSNTGNARLRGFEFTYSLPKRFRLGVDVFSSYTYGTINETTKFIKNSSGQITGEETIKNDPVAEIPPFEISSIFSYKFFNNKFIPKFTLRYVAQKSKVSASQFEKESPGFMIAHLSLYYSVNRFLTMSGGINNIFDRAYYEHLNRNIVGSNNNLYEPGRTFYINLMFKI